MKKEQIKGSLIIILAAIIWGAAFVAQSVGMDYVGPFTFNCVRTLIGGIVLIPCIAFLNRGKVKKKTNFTEKKRLLLGGICCGIALATGSTLQQFGIMYTTVGKAGFITACYIVIVPLLGVFLHKKIGWKVWLAVGIALVGLYFLCITESLSIGKGDLYVLFGALVFSLHILVIDSFFAESGWRENVLHSVLSMWSGINGTYVFVGDTKSGERICRLVSASLCRRIFQWSCLYFTDCRTEEYESCHRFSYIKYGILLCGTCRLADTWRTVVHKRECRVCFNVCSCNSGSAS